MRALGSLIIAASLGATASAEPPRLGLASPACDALSNHIVQLVGGDRSESTMIARRCDKDRWAPDVQACFVGATTEQSSGQCLDRLSRDQQRELAGDTDRLEPGKTEEQRTQRRRFAQWISRRPLVAFMASARSGEPTFALAVSTATDAIKSRALHDQGMSAYQAGRYEIAVKKFAAANDANPNPGLLYHMAQAYRLKGDWTNALELYEKYLEIAPSGPAASDCHHQIEALLDQLP